MFVSIHFFALFLVANDEGNLVFFLLFFSFGMFLVTLLVFNTLFGFLPFGVASGNGMRDWIILVI